MLADPACEDALLSHAMEVAGSGVLLVPTMHRSRAHGWLLLIHGSPLQDQPIKRWALYRKHSQDKPASVSFSVPSLLQKHEEHVVCVEVREEICSLTSLAHSLGSLLSCFDHLSGS